MKEIETIGTIEKKILSYKIVKSNELINAKSDFTALQHRIILFALVQIKPTDESLHPYKIEMGDILKDKSHYRYVRRSIKRLNDSMISINEKGIWIDYPFVIKSRELKEGRHIFIEVVFAKEIQRFLLDLKVQYTTYTLANVINFNHNYSLRIYELCKQYEKMKTRDIKLEYLRAVLNLENKYKNFAHFKLRVLNPSVEEINNHSDIKLKLDYPPKVEKSQSVRFLISKNLKNNTQKFTVRTHTIYDIIDNTIDVSHDIRLNRFSEFTFKRLNLLGFDIQAISEFQDNYSNTRMNGVLNLLDNQNSTIKNRQGWIVSALKKGYDIIKSNADGNSNNVDFGLQQMLNDITNKKRFNSN